ncbi:hypothetical protein LIER_37683 [Lithospermum erythrorhizon]|uniref:Reverse transcriptase Ty1/copia-type domain-containing protein n=1 Tax=Lithospermum erythrorhizon TaxID=34254 RepID=A0AAV3PNZ7_LITER
MKVWPQGKKDRVDYRKMVGILGKTYFISKILNNKSDEFGNVTNNKARFVAQGYTQIEGVYFEETFAPPNGFIDADRSDHVFRLKRVLFGVKQAPKACYERLTNYLLKNGYTRGGVDNTSFIMKEKDHLMVAQIYVDDIVFEEVSNQLITKDEGGKYVDISAYRSMIESLLYLTTSRADIAHSVGFCGRYQADPKESHLNLVKRILKYIQGTFNHDLLYTFDSNNSLVGYCDVDWQGNTEDKRVPLEIVSSWVITLFHGLAKSKIMCLCLLLKLSILLLEVVAPNHLARVGSTDTLISHARGSKRVEKHVDRVVDDVVVGAQHLSVENVGGEKEDVPEKMSGNVEGGAVDSPVENQDENDVVVVSYTTSKNRVVDVEADKEPTEAVDVEELENLAEKRKVVKKGKGKANRPSTDKYREPIPKKRKGVSISEPKNPIRGDRFVLDYAADEFEEEDIGEILKKRSKGKLKKYDNKNKVNKRRIAKDVPDVPIVRVDFNSEKHEARWKFICGKNNLLERYMFDMLEINEN